MTARIPDAWVIIKIYTPEYGTVYKILAGWYGGYEWGDSWRMSSGMGKVLDKGDYWYAPQESGSEYELVKSRERLTGLTSGVLETSRLRCEEIQGTLDVLTMEEYLNEIGISE